MGIKLLKTAVIAATLGAVATSGANAGQKLKIQTSANASHFSLAYMKENGWIEEFANRTGGRYEIELLPIKAVVPHRETPKAVSNGILDGDLTSSSYFSGLDKSFAIIGDLIAGYDTPEQIQEFCRNGGGSQMLQKMFDQIQPGVQVVGCGSYAREAFVSKVPINGVADLKGLKIRSPEGLASAVFKLAGAAPVSLPGSETYGALEKGVIDAADNSAYANNDANGMHKVAKFPIYPGIHSMPVLQFTLNQKTWNKMSAQDQQAIQQWYYDMYAGLTKATRAKDEELVARDKAAGELTIIDWPQAERDKLREIAVTAWEDYAQASDLAKEAYATHINYMKAKGLLKAN